MILFVGAESVLPGSGRCISAGKFQADPEKADPSRALAASGQCTVRPQLHPTAKVCGVGVWGGCVGMCVILHWIYSEVGAQNYDIFYLHVFKLQHGVKHGRLRVCLSLTTS